MKKEDLDFIDWEGECFGAGYGTGELPILKAVKIFFSTLSDTSYSYEILEEKLGDTVTWLLINAFDKANMIEWGTSARFGWITSCGVLLREYIKDKSPEDLYEILMSDHEAVCQCGGEMNVSGNKYGDHSMCGKNPFRNEKLADSIVFKRK